MINNFARGIDYSLIEKAWPEWHIVRLIGESYFSKVYEIQHEEKNRIIRAALKIINIPKDDQEIQNVINSGINGQDVRLYFRRRVKEIEEQCILMKELHNSPNIVSYEECKVVENEGGSGWTVLIRMELLTPFLEYFEKAGVSEKLVIKSGIDMCKALEECAAHNIVHGDIRFDNLFITGNESIKLGDLSISKRLQSASTRANADDIYSFMAPEIYRGQSEDVFSDIYSVGIVLYRMMNENNGPFERTEDKKVAQERRFRGESFSDPAHGSEQLKSIVMRALAYNPAQRYKSATEFRKALESITETPLTTPKNIEEPDNDDIPIHIQEKGDIGKTDKTENDPDDSEQKKRVLILGLLSAFLVTVILILANKLNNLKPDVPTEVSEVDRSQQEQGGDISLVTEGGSANSANQGESFITVYSENTSPDSVDDSYEEEASAPKILVDSSVILLGDTIPVRFFDGKNTYAYTEGLSYYSVPNTIDIGTNDLFYRYYLNASSKGMTTLIGQKGDQELEKTIYVLDEREATNQLICDTDKLTFNVTASGPGAAIIKVAVDGDYDGELEARVYTNAGDNKSGDVWVTATGKWDKGILTITVTNYLSTGKKGELVIVITNKGDPLHLVGFVRIPIEQG